MRIRLSYANVASTLALVIAMGGTTAFAASQLARNSVGTKQLKAGAVTRPKLKKGAVSGAKVANGSLTGADVAERTLRTVPSADHAASADTASRLGVLPSGQSESGFFAANSGVDAEHLVDSVTFTRELAAPIPVANVEALLVGEKSAQCPGPGMAARGHLCIYNAVGGFGVSSTADVFGLSGGIHDGSDRSGFLMEWRASGVPAQIFGVWTVTAP